MHFEWGMPQTPYLIHDTTKAPHITGSGVLLIVNCLLKSIKTLHSRTSFQDSTHLWSSPLNRNLSSMRDVVICISKITCHPKVSNLCVYFRAINESLVEITYFASSIFRHQNVPGCQISVDE